MAAPLSAFLQSVAHRAHRHRNCPVRSVSALPVLLSTTSLRWQRWIAPVATPPGRWLLPQPREIPRRVRLGLQIPPLPPAVHRSALGVLSVCSPSAPSFSVGQWAWFISFDAPRARAGCSSRTEAKNRLHTINQSPTRLYPFITA